MGPAVLPTGSDEGVGLRSLPSKWKKGVLQQAGLPFFQRYGPV